MATDVDPVERLARAAERAATNAGKAATLAEKADSRSDALETRTAALEARVVALEHPWWARLLTALAAAPWLQRSVALALLIVVVSICAWAVPGLQSAFAGVIGGLLGQNP